MNPRTPSAGVGGNGAAFAGEQLRMLGPKDMAPLADDALLFTRRDGASLYVCASSLDGKEPTIYGFLQTSGLGMLIADRNFIYAVKGFSMVRFKR
jgi:hypothetical protein